MDFSAATASRLYNDRSVDPAWAAWCREVLAPEGRDVVDIGCGGGIYSRGFAALGARSVVGVDRSAQYVDEAARSAPRLSFRQGTASDTGLASACADLVFERALIHHLSDAERRDNAFERNGCCATVACFACRTARSKTRRRSTPTSGFARP